MSPMSAIQNQTISPFKREDVRSQKLEFMCRAASDLFNKNGYEATSLDEVAAVLSISKPSIYYYFKNKSELLLACYERTLDICEELLEMAKAENGSGLDQLSFFIENLIVLHCSNGSIAVVSDVDALPNEAKAGIRARSRALTEGLEGLAILGAKDGSIRQDLAPIITRFIMGGVNWIPKWHSDEGNLSPQEVAKAYLSFLTNGIGAS
ncbi:TetR/AcrR family transcriptional regulator [uncultured Maritalea sp.]|uniref:TetR/AcrR family transcriptional regulator n=1 Tax=uncultured Maritalea sp. TaxID=757249 RepID=UPI002621772D|nr:TetR/AcrR family transcriptional regulator [uncultured Maritalea sp.]